MLAVGNEILCLNVGEHRSFGDGRIVGRAKFCAGFTLLELIVVVAIIAIASGAVTLSLRDSEQSLVQREGERLAAQLDVARARSRAMGVAVVWHANDKGYWFEPGDGIQTIWLSSSVKTQVSATLSLGPEPVIGAQQVSLFAGKNGVHVNTDGLRPFSVQPASLIAP